MHGMSEDRILGRDAELVQKLNDAALAMFAPHGLDHRF